MLLITLALIDAALNPPDRVNYVDINKQKRRDRRAEKLKAIRLRQQNHNGRQLALNFD